jgi:hypothetical protein
MFTISHKTTEAAARTVSMRKTYTVAAAGDDRRVEPAKGEFAKLMQAHVTSLDAIVHGFAAAGALHF